MTIWNTATIQVDSAKTIPLRYTFYINIFVTSNKKNVWKSGNTIFFLVFLVSWFVSTHVFSRIFMQQVYDFLHVPIVPDNNAAGTCWTRTSRATSSSRLCSPLSQSCRAISGKSSFANIFKNIISDIEII